MGWTDLTLFAGLFICLAGVVMTVRQAGRRWRAQQPRVRSTNYLEGIGDLSGPATIFGGIAMMQLGSLAEHLHEGTWPPNLRLSLVSSGVVLLVLGIQLGHLLMRWQLRRLLAGLDTERRDHAALIGSGIRLTHKSNYGDSALNLSIAPLLAASAAISRISRCRLLVKRRRSKMHCHRNSVTVIPAVIP